MSVHQHFPRNATVKIPIDLPLFTGTTQQTGELANVSMRIIRLEDFTTLDNVDGVFRLSAVTPAVSGLAAATDYAYDYFKNVDASGWKRGNYRALFRHSTSSREWQFDFSVGLQVQRSLGHSAVYDGSTLNLSVWVEENGEVQTDYTELNTCQILGSTGAVISGGSLTTNSSPTNGVFNFVKQVDLPPVTNFIFSCNAVVPAYASNFTFPLRLGLVRP